MPFQWTVERERSMLLMIACYLNSKPSNDIWKAVAGTLGEGLTVSAVSQKYHKMRKDAIENSTAGATFTLPATPTKRKSRTTDDKITKPKTPKKRVKKPISKEEDLDGGSWSSSGSFQEQLGSPTFPEYSFLTEQNSQEEAVWTEVKGTRMGEQWSFSYLE